MKTERRTSSSKKNTFEFLVQLGAQQVLPCCALALNVVFRLAVINVLHWRKASILVEVVTPHVVIGVERARGGKNSEVLRVVLAS